VTAGRRAPTRRQAPLSSYQYPLLRRAHALPAKEEGGARAAREKGKNLPLLHLKLILFATTIMANMGLQLPPFRRLPTERCA